MPFFARQVTGFLTKFDILSDPVQLTLEGKKSYKTIPGAILTIVMLSGLLAYALYVIGEEATEPWIFVEDTQAVPFEKIAGTELNLLDFHLLPLFLDRGSK